MGRVLRLLAFALVTSKGLLGLVVEGVHSTRGQTHYLRTQDSVFEDTGLSEGATLADTAQRMLELGAVDAMNLDGRGSTQLFAGADALVRPNGTQGVHSMYFLPLMTV